MTEQAKNMLRESLIPVILGDTLRSHLLALRIYLRCGVVSYICDAKKSPLSFIDPFSRYFPLFSNDMGDVALRSLSYVASNTDYLPLLIVCDGRQRDFVLHNREFLEARFIISDSSVLFSDSPLSELI